MDKPTNPPTSTPAPAPIKEFEYPAFDKALRQLFSLLEAVYRIRLIVLKGQNNGQRTVTSPVYTSYIAFTQHYYIDLDDEHLEHKKLFSDLWSKYKVAILANSDTWLKDGNIILKPVVPEKEKKRGKPSKTARPQLNLSNFYGIAKTLPNAEEYTRSVMSTLCQIFLSLLPPIVRIKSAKGPIEVSPEEKQLESEYACLVALAKLDPKSQKETDDLTQVSVIVQKLTKGINLKGLKSGNIKSDEFVDTLVGNADTLVTDMGGPGISDGVKSKLKQVTTKVTNSMNKEGANPSSILKDVMQELAPEMAKSPQASAAADAAMKSVAAFDKPPAGTPQGSSAVFDTTPATVPNSANSTPKTVNNTPKPDEGDLIKL